MLLYIQFLKIMNYITSGEILQFEGFYHISIAGEEPVMPTAKPLHLWEPQDVKYYGRKTVNQTGWWPFTWQHERPDYDRILRVARKSGYTLPTLDTAQTLFSGQSLSEGWRYFDLLFPRVTYTKGPTAELSTGCYVLYMGFVEYEWRANLIDANSVQARKFFVPVFMR